MSDNAFLKPIEFYQRKVNPIAQYIQQTSYYLSKMTGVPVDTCRKQVSTSLKQKKFENTTDPRVNYYERCGTTGDKEKKETRLSHYLTSLVAEKEILAPTFTTYVNTSVKRSPLVAFIDGNKKKRSKAKKEAAAAKAAGNIPLYIAKENDQANMKLYNNSISGAFAAKGSGLFNPTAHSTLTSITRSVSSVGNSFNEKIISGSRHYRTPDITLNNIIFIASITDSKAIKDVMDKYWLHYPTVAETMACIAYSSGLYWKDDRALGKIAEFVAKLSEQERANIVYGGDLYHLRKLNDTFIRQFITRLSAKITNTSIITDKSIENAIEFLYTADEMVVNYAHQICISELEGVGKDYKRLSEANVNTLAATVVNIMDTIKSYKDFIDTFFLTYNVPSTTAYIPNMIRRSVVLSDTDSTMFSVDEWVQWYFGSVIFTPQAFAVSGSVMFIATQCIAHGLAMLSANINVERAKLFDLAMKPEFVFPVFCSAGGAAKHYFTAIKVKEGSVYSEIEMEIKGVHLKNSATPKNLVKAAKQKMTDIVTTIMANKPISIIAELKYVADIERSIATSLLNGEMAYYKQAKIKEASAYKVPEQSPYLHHTLWEEVFAPKYGSFGNPVYEVIKVPTNMDTERRTLSWIETIADRDIADRLLAWMSRNNKRILATLYLSTQYVKSDGIPKEIMPVIDIKRVQLELTMANRLILESLGFFSKSGLLISEQGY